MLALRPYLPLPYTVPHLHRVVQLIPPRLQQQQSISVSRIRSYNNFLALATTPHNTTMDRRRQDQQQQHRYRRRQGRGSNTGSISIISFSTMTMIIHYQHCHHRLPRHNRRPLRHRLRIQQ
jgi:hypothetical protein